jgi:hypothetical protein
MGLDVTNSKQVAGVSPAAFRDVGTLHRDAIAAADRLATPTAISTTADVATGGSLLASTTYKVNYAGFNRWGPTICPSAASRATAADASNTHVIRVTVPQLAGADGYDLFLSTDAAPLWVARITEAQRAAGVTITALGTVDATSPGAGKVDVQVVGSGVASTASPFDINNAWTPGAVTAVDCRGFSKAKVLVKLALTDLRSLPTCKIGVFLANQLSSGDWHQVGVLDLAPLSALGKPLLQELDVDVHGSSGLIALVNTLTGQGAAVSIWVELA